MTLYYGFTEEEVVFENLTLDIFADEGFRAGKILEALLRLEGLPGSMTRVLTMAVRLLEKTKQEAADGEYYQLRMTQNEDQLLLACLHTALIWECG